MSIDDSDFDRLVAGEPFADDPAWSDASAFLDDLRSAYPPESTAGLEAAHLAAVAREARVVAAAAEPTGADVLSLRRARFRRVLVSSVVGASVLLTAGVGAAAAMGFNPIAQLVAPRIDLPITPTPAPPSDGNPSATDGGRPGDHRPSSDPSVPPATVPTPTGTPTEGSTVDPTSKPTKAEKTKKPKQEKKPKKDKKDKSSNGKSDEAKSKDKTNNGKKEDLP